MAVIPNRDRRSIMIDLTSLPSAVGELDEKKVMSMLQEFVAGAPETEEAAQAITASVSYTHLDVYKRQIVYPLQHFSGL